MIADYLEAAWGDSIDNPTYLDILNFIEKLKKSDKEHGAFWVRMEDEMVLEVHQDLTVILVDQTSLEDEETRTKAKDWEEVKSYYQLFLARSRDFIK
jgi:hypothetical protein